jgi:hypothetical protein
LKKKKKKKKKMRREKIFFFVFSTFSLIFFFFPISNKPVQNRTTRSLPAGTFNPEYVMDLTVAPVHVSNAIRHKRRPQRNTRRTSGRDQRRHRHNGGHATTPSKLIFSAPCRSAALVRARIDARDECLTLVQLFALLCVVATNRAAPLARASAPLAGRRADPPARRDSPQQWRHRASLRSSSPTCNMS